MSSLKHMIRERKVDELYGVIRDPGRKLTATPTDGSAKYMYYTKYESNKWVIGVSNGIDIWQTSVDESDLDDMRDVAKCATIEDYLNRFRSAFVSGEIDIALEGIKIVLTLGRGTNSLHFDMYEMTSAERKTELQTLLFKFVEKTIGLESKLKTEQQNSENLSRRNKGGSTGFVDLDSGKNTGVKAQPKTAGMSAINPTSKKRKAATGVVFE